MPARSEALQAGATKEASPAVEAPVREEPVRETPKPSVRLAATEPRGTSRKEKLPKKGPAFGVLKRVGLGAIIVLCVVGWLTWSGRQDIGAAIDPSKYQAVFFTNGQVYFGKLHRFNKEGLKLTDIFYLRVQANKQGATTTNPQETANDQNNVELIKLGDEVHGPSDEMVIAKDQLLFYESIKSDGAVAKSIEQYKSTHE